MTKWQWQNDDDEMTMTKWRWQNDDNEMTKKWRWRNDGDEMTTTKWRWQNDNDEMMVTKLRWRNDDNEMTMTKWWWRNDDEMMVTKWRRNDDDDIEDNDSDDDDDANLYLYPLGWHTANLMVCVVCSCATSPYREVWRVKGGIRSGETLCHNIYPAWPITTVSLAANTYCMMDCHSSCAPHIVGPRVQFSGACEQSHWWPASAYSRRPYVISGSSSN